MHVNSTAEVIFAFRALDLFTWDIFHLLLDDTVMPSKHLICKNNFEDVVFPFSFTQSTLMYDYNCTVLSFLEIGRSLCDCKRKRISPT